MKATTRMIQMYFAALRIDCSTGRNSWRRAAEAGGRSGGTTGRNSRENYPPGSAKIKGAHDFCAPLSLTSLIGAL